MAILDPRLSKALESAPESRKLNVFVKVAPASALKVDGPSQAKLARGLVSRIANAVGVTPNFQYRQVDNVLQIVASPLFVRKLAEQPEVQSMSMAPEYGSAMIEPINTKIVDATAIDRPIKLRGG
jgi:hypothetical protein